MVSSLSVALVSATLLILSALLPVYTYIGGVGMLLCKLIYHFSSHRSLADSSFFPTAAIFEIIVGNSFGFVVFATFSGYWFSLASLFTTGFGVAANTAAAGAIGPILQSQGIGFWQVNCFASIPFTWLLLTRQALACRSRSSSSTPSSSLLVSIEAAPSLFLCIWLTSHLLAALRTNIVFVSIFTTLWPLFLSL